MAPVTNEIVILSGNTHPTLADEICTRLGVRRTSTSLYHAGNRETLVSLPDSVRSRDVYIVQTATFKNVNDAMMELLLLGYTCKTSAAKAIVGVMPYLPYAKQAKTNKRSAIALKLMAKLISNAGFTHIITIDLHHRETQGFFDIPCENLRAYPFIIADVIQVMFEMQISRTQAVIVARHPSVVGKATLYAQRLNIDLAVLHGTSHEESEGDDGRSSPPRITSIDMIPGRDAFPFLNSNFQEVPLTIVGNVTDRLAILVDDIIDEVENFITAAEFLKEQGATKVHLYATHALYSLEQARQLQNSVIDQIVVTNSIPPEPTIVSECPKIRTIDISILLTEAIRRIHNHESLSHLFKEISTIG